MKKLFLFLFSIFSIYGFTQVGINTNTPNGASVLDIVSTDKGVLLPRLTNAQRDATLADNDLATVPPAGVVNTAITPGLLIYNTDENSFQYWDGTLWRYVYTNTLIGSGKGNEGVVKVNAGSGGIKPDFLLNASGNGFSAAAEVVYVPALVYAPHPTTSWPENIASPTDADIYTDFMNNGDFRWKENPIPGQVHIWRVIAHATPGSNSSGSLLATLMNPDSGFATSSVGYLPAGSAGEGQLITFILYSIADGASIGDGKGYKIYIQADADCTVTIDSVTRISNHKD